MRKLLQRALATAILALPLCALAADNALSAPQVTVTALPATVTVDISLDVDRPLVSLGFSLEFNPDYLETAAGQVQRVVARFPNGTAADVSVAPGQITWSAADFVGGTVISSGGGPLVSVEFTVKAALADAPGQTALLHLKEVKEVYDTSLNVVTIGTVQDGSLRLDATPPTVTLASTAPAPTNTSPIPFTVTFSEPVTGFGLGDVSVTNGAAAITGGSGATYSLSVAPTTHQGTVTVNLAAGVCTDAAGNPNTAAASISRVYDSIPTTVTIEQASVQADPTAGIPILFTVVFSEPVSGFVTGDVTLGGTAGATTATITGSGTTYNVAVSGMTGSGTVVATVAAGQASDAAGNTNTDSTSTDNQVTFGSPVQATHISAGYIPGGACIVTCTFTYTTKPDSLIWQATTPPNWHYTSDSSSGTTSKPSDGQTGETTPLEWIWSSAALPASPFSFSYTLAVPAGESGDRSVAATTVAWYGDTQDSATVTPDPLHVLPPTPRHTVTFKPGEHGTLAGGMPEVTVTVDCGAAAPTPPTVTPAEGWAFAGWLPGLPATITGDVETTAQYGENTGPALYAWGSRGQGQLGCGPGADIRSPALILPGGVAQVSAGESHSLIVKTDGSLWACGSNGYGQLGDSTTTNRDTLVPVRNMSSGVVQVSAGFQHSLVVKVDGSLWACGYNRDGRLGDNTYTDSETPVPVHNMASGVAQVSAGVSHSLILKTDGSLWGCGRSGYGQLGGGALTTTPWPAVILPGGVAQVSAGAYHSLIVKTDGSLWAGGYNGFGQLGDGTTTDRKALVRILPGGVARVAAGESHSLILKTDGSLWACGLNDRGQLGDGTDRNRKTLVPILPGGVAQVSAGGNHSLIVKTDGSLWACGLNDRGQLGDGTTVSQNVPVRILSGGVVAVAAGGYHSLAVLNRYTLAFVAGANGSLTGQLDQTVTHGNTTTPVAAVAAAGYDFVRWLRDGGEFSRDNPLTLTNVQGAMTLTAEFAFIETKTITFVAGPSVLLSGDLVQAVPFRGNTTPVSAQPEFGYVLQWSDGSTENPRTLTAVTASQTLTASFRVATPLPPAGDFLARTAVADTAARGLWDLTGTYTTIIGGSPLTLDVVHDAGGRLVGSGSCTLPNTALLTMPVKGSVKGTAGCLRATMTLRGVAAGGASSVKLTLNLTLDRSTCQLVGTAVGSIKVNGVTSRVSETVALDIPAPMDGTWTLQFGLGQAGRTITGTARLTLANGMDYAFLVRGRTGANGTAVLSLAADPADPAARSIRISTTVTPLEGGWARLESFLGTGYGQTVGR